MPELFHRFRPLLFDMRVRWQEERTLPAHFPFHRWIEESAAEDAAPEATWTEYQVRVVTADSKVGEERKVILVLTGPATICVALTCCCLIFLQALCFPDSTQRGRLPQSAGTNARVFAKLVGTDASSDDIELADSDNNRIP